MPITRRALLAIPLLALAALMILVPMGVVRAATTYNVTLHVIGPNNVEAGLVPVFVVLLNGTQIVATGTNSSGYAKFSLPNGTYLILVDGNNSILGLNFYMFALEKVAGTTHITLNASAMHYADVMSAPITATFDILKPDGVNFTIGPLDTNMTVYGDHNATLKFPSEVTNFPYVYPLRYISNATKKVNLTQIFVNFTYGSQKVLANYGAQLAYTSSSFDLAVGLIILVVVGGAIYAGYHAIYHSIQDSLARQLKYVRRLADADITGDHFVRRTDGEDSRHYVNKEDG